MTNNHRTHNWPAPTGPMLATTTPPKRDNTAGAVWFVMAILGFLVAVGLYLYAENEVEADNIFMAGDQSQAANYAPAIVFAVAGVVALIIGAIYSSAGRD